MKKLLTCLLVLILALGCTAYADESTATITATGSGVVMVEADIATISLGVMEQHADVITAQNAVNQKIAAIRVDTLGVEYPEPKKLPDPYGRF